MKRTNNTWRYEGTLEDKYMWALKKDAEKRRMTRPDGWPSKAYIDKFNDYADRLFDSGYDNTITSEDYSLETLHSYVENFLYRYNLEFDGDVLGRPSMRERKSWFK
jgi:hypothetical protein